ncbi:serine peptidase [Youhaiella tibetensis]|uniref:Probable periplasmic serine endoprotease DegP-like n=1 Tax=Paradevosia tibetensis TaxID=1447062 RepID=A0A5B9DKY3_9HYPH|nr:Do family serine endopeptidase [Youhaiella tibetensis]AKR54754.1 HtrA protease/chaperone protein [Devosia sp. H5989]QEE19874.1 Do family serine endopeptidase [Youhaiella tibetensis]GGF29143.1 serine peptidase [Youhaiella tibetensis]
MRSTTISRARRWVGASALAIIVGLGGVSTFVATSQTANAQISAPTIAAPSFADLVAAVKPAVVSIQVEGEETTSQNIQGGRNFQFQIPDLPDDHPLKRFFDQFGNQFGQQGPATPRKYMAAGSGFVISADGYIVTNNHVVKNADKVTVIFDNGDEMSAKVIGTDEKTDVAVVKVDGKDLPFVEFAADTIRVGDWVIAVGNPFGLGGTVTSGIVSARGRDIGGSSYGDFLQIDAAVNTGNSGGPAFDTSGKVVGMNTAIYSPNGGNVGIAFAIPASTIKPIVQQLIDKGSVTRGFLGVQIQDVTHDIANSVGLKNAKGALVTEPSDGGPAQKAGINSGDIITAVDGTPIDNALALSRTIANKTPGTKVELSVWRNGKEDKVSVTLDTLKDQAAPTQQEQPAQPEAPKPSSVGITLVPNSGGDGMLIQDIDPSSVAADKGFTVGDVILEVDNKKVSTVDEFEKAIQGVKDSGRGTALIKASRDGNTRFIGLPLDAGK